MAGNWKNELSKLKEHLPKEHLPKEIIVPKEEDKHKEKFKEKYKKEKKLEDEKETIFTRLKNIILEKGYYDFENNIFNEEIIEMAPFLTTELQLNLPSKSKEGMFLFFRKLLNDIQRLAFIYRENENIAMDRLKLDIHIIETKIAYEAAKGVITKDFKYIFDNCLQYILKLPKEKVGYSLEGLKKFTESLYAFFYFQMKDSKK